MANDLTARLEACGYPVVTLGDARGGQLVILPFGGRLLGAFLPAAADNFLWTNPAIFDREKFLAGPGWKNIGGERTWIAPERELFIQDLARPGETYHVPEVIDPGGYRVVSWDSHRVELVNDAEVVSLQTRMKATIRIQKSLQLLESSPESLRYRQTTVLMLVEPAGGLQLGLWHLAQLPARGRILVGTAKRASYRTYFGEDTQRRVRVGEKGLAFDVTATESHKIGIKADGLTGRLGYLRRIAPDRWSLYARTMSLDPAGPYVDTPWEDPDDTGYAVQCYNDNGQYGAFGELEYHAPAVGGRTGRTEYRDVGDVTLLTGTLARVTEAATTSLGFAPGFFAEISHVSLD